jgi:hypothetical protein
LADGSFFTTFVSSDTGYVVRAGRKRRLADLSGKGQPEGII